MRLPSVPFPTRRLAVAVAVASLLWLLPGSAGTVAGAAGLVLLLALAIGDAIFLPARGDILLERDVPASLGVGDTQVGEYRLRSRAPRGVHVTLHDAPAPGVARHGTRPWPLDLPAGAERVVPLELEGRARGRWAAGPVALRVQSRLGLAQRTLRYEPDEWITVTPSIAGIRHYRLLTLQHRMRDLGIRSTRRRGEGTTFSNLREYQLGDDPRHIDWKATARRRKLISREHTLEQGQTIFIAIDAGRLMTQFAGPLPRIEYALNAALVLADVAVSSGDRVGAIAFDDEVRAFVPALSGAGAVARLREALTPVRATTVEPDYALAFRTMAARHRKRSLIVLITDVIDVRASQALIAYTARTAARHLPLVVALRNEQLLAAAASRDDQVMALYERAAAEELLQAREEALLRMRRAGVSVLDVAPEAMAAAVINRYLELKARASL